MIETLIRSKTFQDYARAFSEATGLPLALRPVETWQLPFHGRRRENSFCALMAEKTHTCAACLQLQAKLAQDATNKPATRTCVYGLCETTVPVKLGPSLLGYLQTGQVLRRNPTDASFQQAVAQAAQRGVDIDNPRTKQAFFKTPVVARKKLAAVVNLLTIFADHLAMKSNQLVVETANAESPIIAKAKHFIEAHSTENLSLGQVSSFVNMSRFYFCKQFSKAAGLSFTEFVSRTRVEKAKTLLFNPNLRISEIAFTAGFQSLSHFSRMFKRIVGQPPIAYRRKLPETTRRRLGGSNCIDSQAEARPGAAQNAFCRENIADSGLIPEPTLKVPAQKNGVAFYPNPATRVRLPTRSG